MRLIQRVYEVARRYWPLNRSSGSMAPSSEQKQQDSGGE